ncbi:MAG: DUF3377 domain-containing protein [Clostridia bacterium]|nr:DUF3377 domain-containing protein [Clostridia bacterium]
MGNRHQKDSAGQRANRTVIASPLRQANKIVSVTIPLLLCILVLFYHIFRFRQVATTKKTAHRMVNGLSQTNVLN